MSSIDNYRHIDHSIKKNILNHNLEKKLSHVDHEEKLCFGKNTFKDGYT